MKMTATSDWKTNSFFPVICHQFNHVTVLHSQISFFLENFDGDVQTL